MTTDWRDQAERVYIENPGSTHDSLMAALDFAETRIRQQVLDELGHDHYVIFTADGWTTEHSVECRMSGHMHECEVHAAIGAWVRWADHPGSGRWRVADWTGDDRDEPVLEPAEAAS